MNPPGLAKCKDTIDQWISLASVEATQQDLVAAAEQFPSVIEQFFKASTSNVRQFRELAISKSPDVVRTISKIFSSSPASKTDLQDFIKRKTADLLKITTVHDSEDWLEPWIVLFNCVKVSSVIRPSTINCILELPQHAFMMAKSNPSICHVAFKAWRRIIVLLPSLPKLLPSKAASILITPLKVRFHPSCSLDILETWVTLLEEASQESPLRSSISNIISAFNTAIKRADWNSENLSSVEACLLRIASDPVLVKNCTTPITEALAYVSANCLWNQLVAESWAFLIGSFSEEVSEAQAMLVKCALIGEESKLPSATVRHQMLLTILAKSAFCLDAPLFPYILCDLKSIFTPLMHLPEFREKIFFPLLVYIKSHSKEIADSSSKINEFWLAMNTILEEYLTTVDKDLSRIDIDIISVTLTLPLFFPSQLWNENDNYPKRMENLASKVKWTDSVRKAVSNTLEEVARDSSLDLGHAIRLASDITQLDTDFDVNNIVTAASRRIVGSSAQVILDYLNLLEGIANKRPTDLARGTLRPSLSLLLRMAASYPPPFDSQIKEMASKLLPRLSSITGSSAQPEEAALRSSPTQPHIIMAQSNFFHRLSKAEEKHGKKGMAASSLFGIHPNEDRRSPGEKENEAKVSANINMAVGTNSESSSSEQDWASAKLASSVRVSSDFHRTDRSPRPARTPRSLQLNSNSPTSSKSPRTPQPPPVEDLSLQDFVFIVPKEKKATPLTDHQKEKMRSRRSDIPALYQDLSQDVSSQDLSSQDSVQFNAEKTLPEGMDEAALAREDASTSETLNNSSPAANRDGSELTFSNKITPDKTTFNDSEPQIVKLEELRIKKKDDQSLGLKDTNTESPVEEKKAESSSGQSSQETMKLPSLAKVESSHKTEETEDAFNSSLLPKTHEKAEDKCRLVDKDDLEKGETKSDTNDLDISVKESTNKTPRNHSARKLDFNNSEIRRSSRKSKSVFKRLDAESAHHLQGKRKYTKKSTIDKDENSEPKSLKENDKDSSESENNRLSKGNEETRQKESDNMEKSTSLESGNPSKCLTDSTGGKSEEISLKKKKKITPKGNNKEMSSTPTVDINEEMQILESNKSNKHLLDTPCHKENDNLVKKRKSVGSKAIDKNVDNNLDNKILPKGNNKEISSTITVDIKEEVQSDKSNKHLLDTACHKEDDNLVKKRKSVDCKANDKNVDNNVDMNNIELMQSSDSKKSNKHSLDAAGDEVEEMLTKKIKSDTKDNKPADITSELSGMIGPTTTEDNKPVDITLDLSGMISPKKSVICEMEVQSSEPPLKEVSSKSILDSTSISEDTNESDSVAANNMSSVSKKNTLKRKLDSSSVKKRVVKRKTLRSAEKEKKQSKGEEANEAQTRVICDTENRILNNSVHSEDTEVDQKEETSEIIKTVKPSSADIDDDVNGIGKVVLNEPTVLVARSAARTLVMVKRVQPVPVEDATNKREESEMKDSVIPTTDLMTPSNQKYIPDTNISSSPEKKPVHMNNKVRRRKTLSPSRFSNFSPKMLRRKSMGDLDKKPSQVQKKEIEEFEAIPDMAEEMEKEFEKSKLEDLCGGKNERKRSCVSLDNWLIRRSAPSPPPLDESTSEFQSSFTLLTSPINDDFIESSQETPIAGLPLSPKSTPLLSTPSGQEEPTTTTDTRVESNSTSENLTTPPNAPSTHVMIKRGDSRERRARRQTQLFRPSIKALLNDTQDNPRCSPRNWPTGDMEPWVPCCPTPPGAGAVTPILKRNANNSISDSPSSTPSKKRVRFVDPVITRGLYYNEKDSSGQIQHPATPVSRSKTSESEMQEVATPKGSDVERQESTMSKVVVDETHTYRHPIFMDDEDDNMYPDEDTMNRSTNTSLPALSNVGEDDKKEMNNDDSDGKNEELAYNMDHDEGSLDTSSYSADAFSPPKFLDKDSEKEDNAVQLSEAEDVEMPEEETEEATENKDEQIEQNTTVAEIEKTSDSSITETTYNNKVTEESPQGSPAKSQEEIDAPGLIHINVHNEDKSVLEEVENSQENECSPTQAARTILRGDAKGCVLVEPLPEITIKTESLVFSSWESIDEAASQADLVLITVDMSEHKAILNQDTNEKINNDMSDTNTVISTGTRSESNDQPDNSNSVANEKKGVQMQNDIDCTPTILNTMSIKQEPVSPGRRHNCTSNLETANVQTDISEPVLANVPQSAVADNDTSVHFVNATEDDPIKMLFNSYNKNNCSIEGLPPYTLATAISYLSQSLSKQLKS